MPVAAWRRLGQKGSMDFAALHGQIRYARIYRENKTRKRMGKAMYRHHEESLKIMEDMFRKREEVTALIFGGSVAKGNERPDSDLDAMAIVSEEHFRELDAQNRTAECISGFCTYEGGYFDVKYMTKEYLRQAAEKGSEPTRNSFVGSRVLYTMDPEITELVAAIPVFQEKEMEEKMLSFYCDLQLNYGYFWKACSPEGYMKIRTASEIIYTIYRLILQENKVLFPCNRRLEETVEKLASKPAGIVELCRRFAETQEDELADRIMESYHGWTSYDYPKDHNVYCSQYCMDFEKWWLFPRPLIGEW